MNPHLLRLHQMAQRPARRIVGLMSGTSLDGLDVALCHVSGYGPQTRVTLEQFATLPYDDQFRSDVRAVFARPQIQFEQLCLLNPAIGRLHGRLVAECLHRWHVLPAEVDLVASHGQTVFHAPRSQHRQDRFPNATLQIGDGDHVAAETGIITLSDFRQRHCAHGGEGAPLAVYGDYFIFSEAGENRLLLNLGGIANFTYLPGNLDATSVFTTDTGPGNTLLDAFARQHFNVAFDEGGRLAAQGVINATLLRALKDHAFFAQPFPKTTGPEVFSADYVVSAQQRSDTSQIGGHDLLATLARFTAETVAEAIGRVMQPGETSYLYLSGGGAHNPAISGHLKALLPDCPMGRTNDLGIDGDAKEAVLFAVLANEAVAAPHVTDFGGRQGVPSVTMGKISVPG